ncbi:sugar transferase [Aerococcus urinaeequi]|uniref:sugar transferase n=1 Tax=Aerococcus urinaeequi TaxID=51665 RepID=UPI003D6A156E
MEISKILKRLFDLIISTFGIILVSPILIVIAVLIKIESKGPVFFKQQRLGLNGLPFSIYKFRTMIVGAEKIGDGLKVRSEVDSRITKIGQFLRKTSLDELPQFFNVIKGDMSLVGPRPPVTYHPYDGYGNYPEWAKMRFCMRPGVTGLSQVTVRNSVPWDERIKYDNKYITEFSLLLDLKILLKTIYKIFKPDSIYLKGD